MAEPGQTNASGTSRTPERPLRVALGCDVAGAVLKPVILAELQAEGVQVLDLTPEPSDDYPDAADVVAKAVARGEADRGILACGTGLGMSIAANKVPGVRAVPVESTYSARMSREHNDANVLCLGGRTLGNGTAAEIVRVWLAAEPSEEERHRRRRHKIARLERDGG